MSELTLTTILLAGAAIIVLALLVGALLLLRRQLQAQQSQYLELQQQFSALLAQQQQQQQQQQNELIAIGQRVLEADKQVRRFSARIDSIETTGPSKTQYGQLESLLSKAIEQEGDASSAESELLALLRQQQRRS
jgi:putative methionine-R-sulfoxide reductase with GAF domain